jgi:hypothetical protein
MPARENELESRVAKLQSDVEHIQSDITDIKADVRELRGDTRALRAELATAKIWALGMYLALAGSLLYVLARGFKWL